MLCSGTNDYGDASDSMGDASVLGSKPLCHNAAYMWRIGWATTINARGDLTGQGDYGNVTAGNFTENVNEIRGLYLPATSVSDRNMIRVALGAINTSVTGFGLAYPTYFISYRSKQSGQPSVSAAAVRQCDAHQCLHLGISHGLALAGLGAEAACACETC